MTLLIVEDEDIIRQGLIITIQKLQFHFSHIYEACDGIEGLRLCMEHTPDIIITDIRMPMMDGLTFIAEAKKASQNSQYIILSGYNDFDYARTALQYGVKDYLLKPSSKSELQETLSNVIGGIEKAQAARQELKHQLDSYAQKLDQFQQLLLGDILLGRYPSGQISSSLSRYAIQLPPEGFFVLCYCILPADSARVTTDYKRYEDWVSSILSEAFQLFPTDILASFHCLIISPISKEKDFLTTSLHKIEEKTRAYENMEGIRLCYSLSSMQSDVQKLPSQYTTASWLLFRRFFSPDTILFLCDDKIDEARNFLVPGAMLESLNNCFLSKSRFDLRQSFLSLLHYLYEAANGNPRIFAAGLEQTAKHLTIFLIRDSHMPEKPILLDFSIEDAFSLCISQDELYNSLLSRLMQYREDILGKHGEQIKNFLSPIEQAISYIDQNYYRELDLASISRLISMNSSYFSSLFKKKTGLTFSTYLQNVRLEKAKKLLLHSNSKLYEISESIGISNVKYFCRLFKNYTGMTPSEFKKQFEQTNDQISSW